MPKRSGGLMISSEQEQFMEQVYQTNVKAGKESLVAGQKEALCEQLSLPEYDVVQWFAKREADDTSNKRMRPAHPGPANRTRSRPKHSIDFSLPLSALGRPLQPITNTDLEALGQYARHLCEGVQKGSDSPSGYCSSMSRVAARASVYQEDRDYASSLGILMVLVEEFAIAREYLSDPFGMVDMFGRLLVRQCAHAVLATNWNVVNHAEELAKIFANVLCNAHILFRSFEINRRKEWEAAKGESDDSPPPRGVQHLDVVAKLVKNPWDALYMQNILSGSPNESVRSGSNKTLELEPSLIIDVRLDVLSHAKDYDSLQQALHFSQFHLNALLNVDRKERNGVVAEEKYSAESDSIALEDNDGDVVMNAGNSKTCSSPSSSSSSSSTSSPVTSVTSEQNIDDPGFDEYLKNKLKQSVVQLYFKLQQWGTAAQLCKVSYGNNVSGMTDILQLLIKASKTFPTAREPALKLATHAIEVEWKTDSYYISSTLTYIWVKFMSEYFSDKLVHHIDQMIEKIQQMSHARFLLEALTPFLKRIVASAGIGDPLVEELVQLGVNIALHAWKIDNTECKMSSSDAKKKVDERANICDWLMSTFTMLGSRSHEIGLLAALASFATAPDFNSFTLIKRLHTQPHTSNNPDERGPSLQIPQHRELVTLLSRVCSEQGLTCLQDPNLNWTKLTKGLLQTKCSTYTTVKICLDERMYDLAAKSVEKAIQFILPPQLSNAKSQKSFASDAYDALQQMLADRNFVTENPQFCYDSAHTLVHNIIRVGSGHGKPNEVHSDVPNSNAGELSFDHFHLLYDAVRVMCFVVNSVDHSRRYQQQHPNGPQKVNLADVNISVGTLYEDLDSLKDIPGLPKDHALLKKLWAGMAEVIQTSLGAQTTQQLLIQKNIISNPEDQSGYY